MMYLISMGLPVDLMAQTQVSLQQSLFLFRQCFDTVRHGASETESDRWRKRMNVMV